MFLKKKKKKKILPAEKKIPTDLKLNPTSTVKFRMFDNEQSTKEASSEGVYSFIIYHPAPTFKASNWFYVALIILSFWTCMKAEVVEYVYNVISVVLFKIVLLEPKVLINPKFQE